MPPTAPAADHQGKGVQAKIPFASFPFTTDRQGQELGNNQVDQVVDDQLAVHLQYRQHGRHPLKA